MRPGGSDLNANRDNPDPENRVGFGNESIDDMSFTWMSFFHMPEDVFEQKLAEQSGNV